MSAPEQLQPGPEQPSACTLMTPLQTQATQWKPADVKVVLNVALDGCIVPTASAGNGNSNASGGGGARCDTARVIVLDGLVDEPARRGLLDALTEPGWAGEGPPPSKWERATCDTALPADRPAATGTGAGDGAAVAAAEAEADAAAAEAEAAVRGSRTWGLKDAALRAFAAGSHPAKLEVQSRLCALYPEAWIAHMPAADMHARPQAQDERQGAPDDDDGERAAKRPRRGGNGGDRRCEGGSGGTEASGSGSDGDGSGELEPKRRHHRAAAVAATAAVTTAAECAQYVANAAVAGDAFAWHVDADPSSLPDCAFATRYGRYFNREPGRPVFVSLLVYLDAEWPRGHQAETLFLDSGTDTGVFVRPKPGRAVLMHQDVVHRLSPPSAAARRPRYSLVWKLVMLPRGGGSGSGTGSGGCSRRGVVELSRPEWGEPLWFGSAGRLRAVVKAAGAAAAAAAAVEGGGGQRV